MPQTWSSSWGVTWSCTGVPMPTEPGLKETMGKGGAAPQALAVTTKSLGVLARPVWSVAVRRKM